MRFRLGLVLGVLCLSGCAHYLNEKRVVTVTEKPDGEKVTVTETCITHLDSMREVNGAAIRVDKDCAVSGDAKKISVNEKMIDVFGTLVNKVP